MDSSSPATLNRCCRRTTLGGLLDVFHQLFEGFTLGGPARDSQSLGPVAIFFGFVNDEFDCHACAPY